MRDPMELPNSSSVEATAPPPLPLDPFRVNVHQVQPTEEEKKKRGRPPTKDRIEEQEIERKKREEAAAFRFTNKLIADQMGADKDKGKAKAQEPTGQKQSTKETYDEGAKLYRKICAYHSTFPHIFHDMKLHAPNSPVHVLQAVLTEMRTRMSSERADALIRGSIPKAAMLMEIVVHDLGINPQGWTLRTPHTSFSKELEKEEVLELLEPELSEAVIECRDWFCAPWYFRLAFRFGILADAFSAQHKPRVVPTQEQVDSSDL